MGLLIILIGVGCSSTSGLLWPNIPSPTPIGTVLPPPIPVNFETLNADPLVFRNKLILVEGIFTSATPTGCIPYKGPQVNWHMVADNLEMDISGLSDVAQLTPELARLKVEGIWRLYEGPLGCGKEPERGFAWYLEAVRVVEPNPLIFSQSGSLVIQSENQVAEEISESAPTDGTENVEATPTATQTVPPTEVVSSPTPLNTATPLPTVTTGSSPPTVTPSRTPSSAAATRQAPTATLVTSITPTGTLDNDLTGTPTAETTEESSTPNAPLPQATNPPESYDSSYP
ncbi:MAG: hypothetical protein AAF633_24745 [Chloroflexota bacterium]